MGDRFRFLADMSRAIWARHKQLSAVFMLFAAWCAITATGGYYFEGDNQEAFGSWWACFYWSVNTVMMVGYGDMTPVTPEGRIVASIGTVVGVAMVLVAGTIVAQAVLEQMQTVATGGRPEGPGSGRPAEASAPRPASGSRPEPGSSARRR